MRLLLVAAVLACVLVTTNGAAIHGRSRTSRQLLQTWQASPIVEYIPLKANTAPMSAPSQTVLTSTIPVAEEVVAPPVVPVLEEPETPAPTTPTTPTTPAPTTPEPEVETPPPPPPPSSGGFVIGTGGEAPPCPFDSTDPNVPTVYGGPTKDGVDPDDCYCAWANGMKYCA